MTAEQLNIRINLDIASLKNNAKQVKQSLAGMTNEVKKSLPRLNKESKEASGSLDKVATAGKKVKDSLEDIGQEAKENLSVISTESEKALGKLNSLSKSNKFSIGFDTEEFVGGTEQASVALDSLKNRLSALIGIDIFSGLASNWDRVSKLVKKITENGWYAPLYRIKEIVKDVGNVIGGHLNQNLKKTSRAMSDLKYDIKIFSQDMKGVIKNLSVEIANFVKGIGAIGAALGATLLAVAGANIANSTKQYREEQSKLTTAFQAAGASAEQASQTYNNLFRFLGDSGKAVEAANHLAKLTTNTQSLAEWTTIAQGVYATFGDSLPIEGLTEAANESIRVGKVTGTLADALNWAGVSEDSMNAALERTTNLEEREVILRQTLNGLYLNAAQIYEQNNRRIIEQNEAQARLNATMAAIGQQTQVLVTSWINLKNVVLTALAPAIVYLSAVFSVLIDKIAAAIQWLGSLFGISFKVGQIGGIVSGATGGVAGGISDAAGAAEDLTDNLDKATGAAQKLKRTTMGFDELNIVNDPNSSGGGGASGGSSAGGGGGGVGDITGIETGNGIFSKLGEQIEDVKSKVEAFFDKWKTQIAIIGTALAALGIATLLEHLGKALGLGDKFLTAMKNIKKLAATAIVITLQYTLVNEFLDKYINGAGFKEYLKGLLVAAIGTGILYSMWGPAGLVIGLGVTAVAAIKAVIDNGGITNVESAVVALTGLAAAVGAVYTAVNLLKTSGIIAKVATSFGTISTAVKGALAAIGGLFGGSVLTGLGVLAAAVVGVVSVVVYLKRNWEDVTSAVKNFFNENIVPKLEAIKESFVKMGEALGKLIPPGLKQLLQDIGSAIADIVKKIAEWFKSVDWIKAIGDAFEWIGEKIVSAVGNKIAKAIDTLVSIIQGAVEAVSGVVQIVSGIIRVIVNLFTFDLKGAWEACKDIANGIVDVFKGLYDGGLGIIINFVKDIIDWFTNLWDKLVGHSIIPDMVKDIIAWFEKLPGKCLEVVKNMVKNIVDKFQEMFGNVRTAIINGWNNIKTYFNQNIAPKFTASYWLNKFDTIRAGIADKIGATRTAVQNGWNNIKKYFNDNIAPKFTKAYWQNKFDTIRAAASEKIEAAKTVFQNGWNNVKTWFTSNVAPKFTASFWKEKFDSIKNGAKDALNGVISVVEKAVNGIIGKINTLSWKIPDWVPKFGGSSFGFNFSTISIPRLAEGGIAVSSTLANVGERGKEAILPLENNTGWMDKLADKIAARQSNAPTKVQLVVDGKELGWATINNINKITKQTGGLQLVL